MQRLLFFAVLASGALATSTATSAQTPLYFAGAAAQITNDPRPGQFPITAGATETVAQEPIPGSASVKCEEAEVNPVTGHAQCVRPRGAPVDPPPQSAVPCSAHYAAGAKRGCRQSPRESNTSS